MEETGPGGRRRIGPPSKNFGKIKGKRSYSKYLGLLPPFPQIFRPSYGSAKGSQQGTMAHPAFAESEIDNLLVKVIIQDDFAIY